MLKYAVLSIPFMLAGPAALAADAQGNGALALAALVSFHSPAIGGGEKAAMHKMLNGKLGFSFPAGKTIDIDADAIDCRAGDVDISAHACDLTFGSKKRSLSGREANELYDAMLAAGVQGDGAAGTVHASVTALKCVVDPNEVKQKGGGGAKCTFS